MYWLSRYIERSDGVLRMLKINYASSQDALNAFSWRPVVKIYSDIKEEKLEQIEFNSREVLEYMVMDKTNPSSIINMITAARENARSVQDHITKDLWQCLNEYYLVIIDPNLAVSLRKDDPVSVLDILMKQIMLYYGTADVTMERGEGRSFMNIGKFLERSIQSADVLHVKFGSLDSDPNLLTDTTYWKHLLSSLGGYELYLRKYRQGIETENILDQIILNNDFPRSVIYSVNNIHRYFSKLKIDNYIEDSNLSFTIGRLQSRIKYSSAKNIDQERLAFITSIKTELHHIGNALNDQYFGYS